MSLNAYSDASLYLLSGQAQNQRHALLVPKPYPHAYHKLGVSSSSSTYYSISSSAYYDDTSLKLADVLCAEMIDGTADGAWSPTVQAILRHQLSGDIELRLGAVLRRAALREPVAAGDALAARR